MQVVYDPTKIAYAQLLEVFWVNIDPVTANRQFCDRGSQYRSGIYYHDAEQERLARESRDDLMSSGRFGDPIVTEVEPVGPFYEAEDYHQDYYQKNPLRYKFYRWNCGRDQRLQELWGDTE